MDPKSEMVSDVAAHHDGKLTPDDIGVAAIAEAGEVENYTPADEKRVRWKIDLHLMPLLMFTYLIQFLDKSCISYSALWGMRKDVGLHGSQYSWLTTIFYIGYLVAEFPMNALFQRLNITKVCGIIISEQPLRTAMWFSMNGMAQIIGGPIAYGIGYIDNALPSWKFPFIIFGSITVAWSIVFFLFATPNPVKAPWLSPHERIIAVSRLASNNTGLDTRVFKPHQAREALLDPKCWLLFLFTVASNIPNGGVVAFGPLIVEGFGYSTLGTTLLGMPSGATQIAALWLSGYAAGRFPRARVALMLGGVGVALAGTVMMYAIPEERKVGRLLGYYLLPGFSATYVLSLGMIQANVAGRTKKGVVTAALFVGEIKRTVSQKRTSTERVSSKAYQT
ncbi:putative mfs allantoate protein [Neofusicoccum parvum UCRNP2]|uniref:Putative mfs allantoate protein n=1 Tax=Botryosphaeria parva (strain UCR-NP2) TaxID=1287680 RepID=R1EAG6_BOTPV|nr:putative mfs allantoate protein [Neofusicoccum parvum UCRNP2]